MRVELVLDDFVLVPDELVLEDPPVVVGVHHCGCMHGYLVEVARLALVLEVLESGSEVNLNELRVCLKRVGVGERLGGRSRRF